MKKYDIPENFEKTLQALGVAAGVRKDWYELGDPEDEDAVCGVYAKDEEEGEKIMDWMMTHCEVETTKEQTDEAN